MEKYDGAEVGEFMILVQKMWAGGQSQRAAVVIWACIKCIVLCLKYIWNSLCFAQKTQKDLGLECF